MNYSSTTFDPRIATAQAVFGIIYLLITLVALSLAFYARAQALAAGEEETQPWIQYFMALLFALLALKSFCIVRRTLSLLRHGRRVAATVVECGSSRGISTIRARAELGEGHAIIFETRYAGEAVARELHEHLQRTGSDAVPALIVGEGRLSRGMVAIRSDHGHLDPASLLHAGAAVPGAAEGGDASAAAAEVTAAGREGADAGAAAAGGAGGGEEAAAEQSRGQPRI